MKVLVDANILISYLLSGNPVHPPGQIVSKAITGELSLYLSKTTVFELRRSVRSKPYLAERIDFDVVQALIEELERHAIILEELTSIVPEVSRDPNDDYLIAHALAESVDVLVSGDKDLLVLQQVAQTLIVSPAEFLVLLEAELST